MRQRLRGEDFESGIVGDLAIFDDAAVAVVGVLAQADVGDYQEIEIRFADGFDGALNDTLCVKLALTARIF